MLEKIKRKNRLNLTKIHQILVLVVAGVLLSFSLFATKNYVQAASNSDFTQTINNGVLATDIRDASRNSVASPSVALNAVSFPFACLSGGSAPSGIFGTNTERIYVDNPGAADNGWTLTLGSTLPTNVWSDGGTNTYDYNDPTAAGCTDGGDADSAAGQMAVDPTVGTITTDCLSCTNTGLTLGSASAFDEGTTDSITLLDAALASDNFGRWYLTDVDVSNSIPAEQAPASYTINLVLTLTAN